MKSITDVLTACKIPAGSKLKLSNRIKNLYKIKNISKNHYMFYMSEDDFIKVVALELKRDKKDHEQKFGSKVTGAINYNRSIGRYTRIGW